MRKKLIEVALPLDDINAACGREKSIRHGHPSTLHLWWARRPLAAARAVIWSSLVDDPSSHPDEFPTEEFQNKERERLFTILRELVIWENSNNDEVLKKANAEILKSTDNNPPALLDPFMGGGAIPLEAQRLGLKAYGADLNPVAVMINKAMYEIPPKFHNMMPVNPEPEYTNDYYNDTGTQGLAEDIEYYGNLLKQKAFEKIGHLYPKAKYINPETKKEEEVTVIAWIWARTVKCPNPACDCEMPLANSFVLSAKKGKEAWIEPVIKGNEISYKVHAGSKCLKDRESIKLGKSTFKCVNCGAVADKEYIHGKFEEESGGVKLIAVVAEGVSGRLYLSPSKEQEELALSIMRPDDTPEEYMNENTPNLVSGRGFGITKWRELFTNRQLTLLTTLSDLLPVIRVQVAKDASKKMSADSKRLADGGVGATAYAEAISVYLAFLIDKLADYHSSFCSWDSSRDGLRNVFGRQAIPIVWDYAEANPFCSSSGCYDNMLEWVVKAVRNLPRNVISGEAVQWDAMQDNGLRNIMVSTDPPYYDNIEYSSLSDFFYIWMRKNLKSVYPSFFSTVLTPKAEELVALACRFDGEKLEAKRFFEDGMLATCKNLFLYSREDIPVTIYYAFKQSDADESGTVSTGWETMLSAIIKAGFTITGTWPMRTEMEARSIASGTNALASSIVIVCRKNIGDKASTTLRDFLAELRAEMIPALKKLQASNIVPVDLAQSAIGPGIAVYSRYAAVIQADGSALSVRDALKLINRELDSHLNEINSGIDVESSLCLTMYTQKGFNQWKYGEIETLATAKNISVEALNKLGVVKSGKGVVELKPREDIEEMTNGISHPCSWLNTQQCVKAYENEGDRGVANAFSILSEKEISDVKSLCYQLYSIADKKGWTAEANAYNTLISGWESAYSHSQQIAKAKAETSVQGELFNGEGE